MRTLTLATIAMLALTACSDNEPTATPTTPPTANVTTTPPTSAPPSTAATPTWPAGCASPPAEPAGATVIKVTVVGNSFVPARKTYDVKLKSAVRIVVSADEKDEVHVHSYDKKVDVLPPCPAFLDLEATIPGTVEVELEEAGLHLFDLRAK